MRLESLLFESETPPLTGSEFRVVMALKRGPKTTGDLIRELNPVLSRRAVINALNTLRARGLVEKRGDVNVLVQEVGIRDMSIVISILALVFAGATQNLPLALFSGFSLLSWAVKGKKFRIKA
ncbi:MAG: MarR family transcriptional regulator [Deltaproteobacteria bacterium]|nr:MarR family transcriptional regulator [Deltaproteobacteria bacterium]